MFLNMLFYAKVFFKQVFFRQCFFPDKFFDKFFVLVFLSDGFFVSPKKRSRYRLFEMKDLFEGQKCTVELKALLNWGTSASKEITVAKKAS